MFDSIFLHLLPLQIVFPLFCAVFSLLIPQRFLAYIFALLVSFVALCGSLIFCYHIWLMGAPLTYVMGNFIVPFGIEYRLDYLSSAMLVLITLMGFLALLWSGLRLGQELLDVRLSSRFYTLYLLALVGSMGIVLTGDAFNLFVFIEVLSLASYGLMGLGRSTVAPLASLVYLILGTVGATFYILGVGMLYMMTGSLNLQDLGQVLLHQGQRLPVIIGFSCITVGLLLKASIFPFHAWLPSIYRYSPSTFTIFMAATTTKLSLYALIRIFLTTFSANAYTFAFVSFVCMILMLLACFSILLGSFFAMIQRNYRTVLGYSSIGQLGYILLGFTFGTQYGLTAALLHFVAHGLSKGALFMTAGHYARILPNTRFSSLAGQGHVSPFTSAAVVFAGMSMIGFPGTIGFISKIALLLGAWETRSYGALCVILLSSFMACVYMWRVITTLYFCKPLDETLLAIPFRKRFSLGSFLALLILLVMIAGFGLFPYYIFEFAHDGAGYLLDTFGMELLNAS